MTYLLSEEIDAYAEAHTTPPPELLQRLAEETKATLSAPQMLTGGVEGRFLDFLVFATRREAHSRAGHLQRLLVDLDGFGASRRRAHRHVRSG